MRRAMDEKKTNSLRLYFRWPVFLLIVLALLAAGGFFIEIRVGMALTLAAALYLIAMLVIYLIFRRTIRKRLVDFGASYAQAQNQLLRQVEVPFLLADESGEVLWANKTFRTLFNSKKRVGPLSTVFPELENADFKKVHKKQVSYNSRTYTLHCAPFRVESARDLGDLGDQSTPSLYNLYLIDDTDLLYYRTTLEEERIVMGQIYIDNYDEVMEGIEYVRRSLLAALLERKLNKYFSQYGGLVRKLEKERYLLVLKQKDFDALEADKFSLLDDIKTVNIGNDMAVTISIGIGLNAPSIDECYTNARAAIDMALGRGGDQVVIRDGTEIRYFGGKAKTTERTTRVKARIKAHALRELIEARESVMIMGHPNSDLDCIGAAMGIYRAAKFSQKKVHIVTGEVNNSVKPLLERFKGNTEYEEELFIGGQRALELFDKDTLLVVVDTNRPSYTVCPDLLKRAESVVVMDHHRLTKERIENALLSYVEPYASSASELVAEIIQYYDDNLKLRPAEADAVFAGIVMDTNNFEDKSGVRTFEAAAYLRRNGADVTRVRKLFRESMQDYKLRAETISNAEVYKDCYVIGICPSRELNRNQTVVAAQAANELLEIKGIKASFVLTSYEHKIYLSARSIDEVNVQVMMEKLGGGGHQSVAGAQFTDSTTEEVTARLKAVIDELG